MDVETTGRALEVEQTCPVCGEGRLERVVAQEVFRYQGHSKAVEVESFRCPHCQERFVDDVSMARVEPRLRQWRKRVDRKGRPALELGRRQVRRYEQTWKLHVFGSVSANR